LRNIIRYFLANAGGEQLGAVRHRLFQPLFFGSFVVNIDCANCGWYHDRSRLFSSCHPAVLKTQVDNKQILRNIYNITVVAT
jgi:hypothetical protein